MQFFKTLTTSLLVGVCTLAASASFATVYSIEALTYGSDRGFTYSLLHKASNRNPMSGKTKAWVESGNGFYNSDTGFFDASFLLSDGVTMNLEGQLDFSDTSDQWLDSMSTLSATFINDSRGKYKDRTFTFLSGDQIRRNRNSDDPNSFKNNFISLWGADGTFREKTYTDWWGNTHTYGKWSGTKLGIDLRVKLTETPLPSTLLLFGTGLIGLGAIRRKAKKA